MTRFDARRAGSRGWRPRTPRQWRTAGRSSRHPWSGRHLSQVPGCHTAPERPLFLLWISVDTWITLPRCGEDVLVTEGAGSNRRLTPSSPRATIRDPMLASEIRRGSHFPTKFSSPFPPIPPCWNWWEGSGTRSGRCAAGQTTSTTKVRRVDFSDCGPMQPPKSHRQPRDRRSCVGQRYLPMARHITKLLWEHARSPPIGIGTRD